MHSQHIFVFLPKIKVACKLHMNIRSIIIREVPFNHGPTQIYKSSEFFLWCCELQVSSAIRAQLSPRDHLGSVSQISKDHVDTCSMGSRSPNGTQLLNYRNEISPRSSDNYPFDSQICTRSSIPIRNKKPKVLRKTKDKHDQQRAKAPS